MGDDYTEADVLRIIREDIAKNGLRSTARRLGITQGYLYDIRWRKRAISESIAIRYGFKREIIKAAIFRKMEEK